MSLHITISFDASKNLAYFDIDTTCMGNPDGIAYPLSHAFSNFTGPELDNLFKLNKELSHIKATTSLSNWRYVAKSIQRGVSMGHLWDLAPDDSRVQWKDAQGCVYEKCSDIPGFADAVHSLGNIELKEFLRTGDPSYNWNDLKATQVCVLPGTWAFELTTRDDNTSGMGNGHRPARLVAYNEGSGPLNMDALLVSSKYHALCDVDSATCGFIFDAPMPNVPAEKDKWYDAVIDPILDAEKLTPSVNFSPELNCVMASTFDGDGSYPMFVQYNEEGQAIAVILVTDLADPLLIKNPYILQECYDNERHGLDV